MIDALLVLICVGYVFVGGIALGMELAYRAWQASQRRQREAGPSPARHDQHALDYATEALR